MSVGPSRFLFIREWLKKTVLMVKIKPQASVGPTETLFKNGSHFLFYMVNGIFPHLQLLYFLLYFLCFMPVRLSLC